jgi:GntR family transcriptional regulator, transcriptional repressor for pyruvate dehydrogenase complex
MTRHGGSDDVSRFLLGAADEPGAGSLSRPLQVPSAVDEVTDRLLTAVAIGEFVPGERLPVERALTQMLGVSRTTIHEAMGRLRKAGVVEIRRGRAGGAFVRSDWSANSANSADAVTRTMAPRWPRLEQLFDLRELVEAMVARVAAERRTPDDIRALQSALAAFTGARSPTEEHAADTAIHRAVAVATQNFEVLGLTQGLLATITLGLPIEPYSRDVFDRACEEHTALVEAVVAGEPEHAARVARAHFAMSARTLRRVLDRGLAVAQDAGTSRDDG